MVNVVLPFNRAKELISDQYSCLELVHTKYEITLPSSYAGRIKKGISDHLKAQTNLYTSCLGGILVAYSNVRLLSNMGTVWFEGSGIHFEIKADFIIFCPKIGKILRGVVNKYGRNYVSCLVHDCYNVSISRPEIGEKWIGDTVDIGYDILFEVTSINLGDKGYFIRGSMVDDSEDSSENRLNSTKWVEGEADNEPEVGNEYEEENNGVVAEQDNGFDIEKCSDEVTHKSKKRKSKENGIEGGKNRKKKRKREENGEEECSIKKKKRKIDEVNKEIKEKKKSKKRKLDGKTNEEKHKTKDKKKKKHKTKDKAKE